METGNVDNNVGKVIGGRYTLTERIGGGGMAIVYKAQDNVLGRSVAIKLMREQYASDPTFEARFKQEAQAAANLQSPYIVNIYDWGKDQNTLFMAMEYVRGIDLRHAIDERGSIDPRKVAEIASQVCAGLAVAHGYDIIHRDIKPHNIMVQPDGTAKIMDFGIARAGNTTMTQTGSVLGTAHYVSPEQAQGLPLTAATDIYSLGIVMYEAATGRLPFDADEAVAVALKQVNEQPIPPRQINPNIDPALESIILKAMAKKPENRFHTAIEMKAALDGYLAGNTGLQQTAVIGAAAAAGAAAGVAAAEHTSVMPTVPGQTIEGWDDDRMVSTSSSNGKDKKKKDDNKKWIWIGVAVVLLALVGLGVAWAMGAFDGGNKVDVPDVLGMTQTEAQTKITSAGFEVGKVEQKFSPDVEAGKVMAQDPKGSEKAAKGSKVNLVISKGIEKGVVPEVVGMAEKDAYNAIKTAGFEPQAAPGEYNNDVREGTVISQTPAGKTEAAKGSVVSYIVSKGSQQSDVPDVVGKSKANATAALEGAGFKVSTTEEYSDSQAAGNVISQNPSAGASVKAGSTVTIVISKGPQPPATVEVPSVLGQSLANAKSTLEGAGFAVTVSPAGATTGSVVSQNPNAGTKVAPGTRITITVETTP